MLRTLGILLLSALCATLFAACGDDGGGAEDTILDDTQVTDSTADADTTVEVDTADPDTAEDAQPDVPVEINLEIPGLDGDVQADFDDNGVLHLSCVSDADCFAALGYFHAANRFFLMDFVRHLMRGRLARMVAVGEVGLETDYANRLFMTTRQGEPLEEAMFANLDAETRAAIERYTDGINAWIGDLAAGRNGAALTREYGFPAMVNNAENMPLWEPEDTMAFALYMFNDLGNSTSEELGYAEQLTGPSVDLTWFQDVYSARPAFDVATMPASGVNWKDIGDQPKAPPVAAWRTRLLASRNLIEGALQAHSVAAGATSSDGLGSNNWVVGPGLTTSGQALLANDPHLALTNPAIFFPAVVDSMTQGNGTLHLAGGTIPGLPAFLVGHNEHIAWGVTTIYYDLTDIYIEELNATGDGVMFYGQEVRFLERDFEFFDAASGETVTQTFQWVPHHGPVLQVDATKGQAITARWTLHDGDSSDMKAFIALNRATSVDAAQAVLADLSGANQNFVVIDDQHNIGWFPFTDHPVRNWDWAAMPPWLPLPGTGEAEWQGYLALADMPQMVNPPNGFIASANQDIIGSSFDGDPANDGFGVLQRIDRAGGVRMQRIVDMIEAGGTQHTPDSMLDIQSDTYSLLGELVVPHLLNASAGATLDPATTAVIDALQSWQMTCPTGLGGPEPAAPATADAAELSESIGCTAFHTTFYALLRAAIDDENAASGLTPEQKPRVAVLVNALTRPQVLNNAIWDDVSTAGTTETMDDIMLTALIDAGALLQTTLGGSDTWLWGRVHTVSLASPFDAFGVWSYNSGPWANDGGLYTVDVANPKDREALDYHHTNGAAIRIVITFDPTGPQLQMQLPGGTDLNRSGRFYDSMLPGWLRSEPADVSFDGPAAPAESFTVHSAP